MTRTETSSDVAKKGALQEQPGSITSTAWVPVDDLRVEEWLHMGRRLGSIGRGAAWWIGDWVNYGNAAFGEKYSRASQITGYDAQSLMNMAYVASRFQLERRRESLSWSHHAELAALPPDTQDHWLDRVESHRMSVRGLREQLRAAQRANAQLESSEDDTEQDDEPVTGQSGTDYETDAEEPSVTCPNCGYHLTT